MKPTYSNKYLTGTLIAIVVLYLSESIYKLFFDFEFYSIFILRIGFILVSLFALLSFFLKNLSGEKYSRQFIILVLILPFLIAFSHFVTDLLFYGMFREEMLKPHLLIQPIIGFLLLFFSLKYSTQSDYEKSKGFGEALNYFGIYLFVLILVSTFENYQMDTFSKMQLIPPVIKLGVAVLIFHFGNQLKENKTKIKRIVIFLSVLLFVYNSVH